MPRGEDGRPWGKVTVEATVIFRSWGGQELSCQVSELLTEATSQTQQS